MTEEKGSEQFHGILSPSIRNTTRAMLAGRPGPTLEIGCADGRFVFPLAQETGKHVVGLDLFAKPFDVSVKKRHEQNVTNLDLLRASGMELPFGDASFDAVVCVNVLNSMPDQEMAWKIVREMVRVCKPGGKIVVDYRNGSNPIIHYRFKWRREKYRGSQLHQITFKHRDMRGAFEAEGCRVERLVPVALPLRSLAPAIVLLAEKTQGE